MFLTALLFSCMPAMSQTPPLEDEQVASFARLALDSIVREFPNKPGQVYTDPESAVVPRVIHPVFYGSNPGLLSRPKSELYCTRS